MRQSQQENYQFMLRLCQEPEELGEVRQAVTSKLVALQAATRAADVCAVATELLTNAYQHAGGPAALLIHVLPKHILITVTDGSSELPVRRDPDWEAESGRGMAIVQALSDRWWAEVTIFGKAVRCVLSRPSLGNAEPVPHQMSECGP
ncbi:ATP-binding protein [Streptomyces sp. NPDC006704]|uniref:ATP-binding protein n=1 Tax=Streptomyces sp. NPDC006704 TaxID=3364760 RepID=UPI0036C89742